MTKPLEYVGNELAIHPVLHPNAEMDARPAWVTLAIGWTRRLTISRHGPTQYGDPRAPDLFGHPCGCGAD